MGSTSSYNVKNLPAAERHTLESMLGQPLSPDQRVSITAYTPRALRTLRVRIVVSCFATGGGTALTAG